jgi:peroxiredoxin
VKLAADLGLRFPLLSDPDLRVATAYGVAMKGRDIAVPSVFVVRTDRSIAFRKVGETMADRPTADEVVAQVTAAR